MKYIKPIFEANNNWYKIKAQDVLDFASNSHLAYLLDEGYIIDVRRQSGGTHDSNDLLNNGSYIRIVNLSGLKSVSKPWPEMKDYIIPFLRRFVNQFGLSDIEISMGLKDAKSTLGIIAIRTFKLEEILNDKVRLGSVNDVVIHWIKIKK
jgi:hypothetical protein